MTSIVKVTAHCASDTEVVIKITDLYSSVPDNEITLNNGDTNEQVIYGQKVVFVFERKKQRDAPVYGQTLL